MSTKTENTTGTVVLELDGASILNTNEVAEMKKDITTNRDDIAQLKSYIGLPPSEPLPDLVFTVDGKCYPPHLAISSGVQSIGANAYQNFPQLKSVRFSDTVTTIGTSAFQNCDGINKVQFSDSVTLIGMNAFQDCTGFAELTLPANTTTIEKYAFSGCSGITGKMVFPETLKFMGDGAFAGCINITEVELPKNKFETGFDCFSNTGIRKIRIPGYFESLKGGFVRDMPNLTSLYIENGVTYMQDNFASNCPLLTDVYLPNSVNRIGAAVFSNCPLLQNVTFEQGFNLSRLNLSSSKLFTVETLVSLFEALADRTELEPNTLILGGSNLAKLTDEQKAIATNKNWVLV